jgi:hypothetical protein
MSGNIAEEVPGAYKDVTAVVDCAEHEGLAPKVCRLRPMLCIKGWPAVVTQPVRYPGRHFSPYLSMHRDHQQGWHAKLWSRWSVWIRRRRSSRLVASGGTSDSRNRKPSASCSKPGAHDTSPGNATAIQGSRLHGPEFPKGIETCISSAAETGVGARIFQEEKVA